VDYDADGNVVGVEMLDASKRLRVEKAEAEKV
jgi:YD repeat-containing protein